MHLGLTRVLLVNCRVETEAAVPAGSPDSFGHHHRGRLLYPLPLTTALGLSPLCSPHASLFFCIPRVIVVTFLFIPTELLEDSNSSLEANSLGLFDRLL